MSEPDPSATPEAGNPLGSNVATRCPPGYPARNVRTHGTRSGAALVTTLLVITVLTITVIAFLQSMTVERLTSRSYLNMHRAELAAEAGAAEAISRIKGQLLNATCNSVAFTTWAYHPNPSTDDHYIAMTVGAPDILSANTTYLDPTNTEWLFSNLVLRDGSGNISFSAAADPDQISSLGTANTTAFNDGSHFFKTREGMRVPWTEASRVLRNGVYEIHRYAYWVDDESSRIHVGLAGNGSVTSAHARGLGASISDLPPFHLTSAPAMGILADLRALLFTPMTLRQGFPADAILPELALLMTTTSRGSDRIQWAPVDPDAADPGRGKPRMNLNWERLYDATTYTAIQRVQWLANWMEQGAPDWVNFGYVAPPGANPGLRRRMIDNIAASIIDYADVDFVPTQDIQIRPGEGLASTDPATLPSPGLNVRLLNATQSPAFFGAEAVPRINEVQIIWNSDPATGTLNSTMNRTSSNGSTTYGIPITWKFELWNMNHSELPARNYAVRGYFVQQIQASAFGFGGTAIPPESEMMFDLGNLTFSPGQVRTVEVTQIFVSTGPNDRGSTWEAFRLGADGTADDQPDGHTRTAYVLHVGGNPAWLHSTTYHEGIEAPVDGLNAVGIGNRGGSKGNQMNDPRMEPLRSFTDLISSPSLITHVLDRDSSSFKPGSLGTVNNQVGASGGPYNYQHFGFWMDRVDGASSTSNYSTANVTSIANRPFYSSAELGNILDPGWSHPGGSGNLAVAATRAKVAYGSTITSHFRGGATLRVGQPCQNSRLWANSWVLMDLFGADSNPAVQFVPTTWSGRVNLNIPRTVQVGNATFGNLALAFQLPGLRTLGNQSIQAGQIVQDCLKTRFTRDGIYPLPDGNRTVTTWRDAGVLFSVGMASELPCWRDPGLLSNQIPLEQHPPPTAQPEPNLRLDRLAVKDATREESFHRTAGLLSTNSHSFRLHVVGQFVTESAVNPSVVHVRATRRLETSAIFLPDHDDSTGALRGVVVERLQTKHP